MSFMVSPLNVDTSSIFSIASCPGALRREIRNCIYFSAAVAYRFFCFDFSVMRSVLHKSVLLSIIILQVFSSHDIKGGNERNYERHRNHHLPLPLLPSRHRIRPRRIRQHYRMPPLRQRNRPLHPRPRPRAAAAPHARRSTLHAARLAIPPPPLPRLFPPPAPRAPRLSRLRLCHRQDPLPSRHPLPHHLRPSRPLRHQPRH